MPETADEIRAMIAAHRRDRGQELDRLTARLYTDLRRVARALRRRAPRPEMGSTSLVHEAYLKLARQGDGSPGDPSHFFALAARTMRHVLIDDARRRCRRKRGGGEVDLQLCDDEIPGVVPAECLLDLDRALERLESHDARLAHIVECRFFAGLTDGETAQTLGITRRTVQRDWNRAKVWLREILVRD